MARAMKDSGVAWIGEIPEEWRIGKTSLFFDIQLGKMLQPESSSAEDSFEYYLCAANLGGNALKMNPLRQMWFSVNDRKQFAVKKGDLLVVEGGDVASCDIIREEVNDLYIQNALHRVRSKNGYSVEYLRYLLMIAKASGHIDLVCNKATIAHFTKDKFGSLAFIVSSVAEQSRIAAFLDLRCAEIDRVIAATQRTIEEYGKLKQSIITEAVTHGVRGPRKMKDSGVEWIGEIPEEWVISRVGLHYDIVLGKMLCSEPPAEDYSLERYFCAANVHFDGISGIDSLKEMWFSPKEKQLYQVRNGDLLIVEGGAGAGGCAIVSGVIWNAYIQNSIMIVRNRACSDSRYLRYLTEYLVKQGYIDVVCNKATIPHFTKDKLATVPYPVLSVDEQGEIADYLDRRCAEIDRLIEAKQRLLAELEAYKKSVIYEYVTGKREVTA